MLFVSALLTHILQQHLVKSPHTSEGDYRYFLHIFSSLSFIPFFWVHDDVWATLQPHMCIMHASYAHYTCIIYMSYVHHIHFRLFFPCNLYVIIWMHKYCSISYSTLPTCHICHPIHIIGMMHMQWHMKLHLGWVSADPILGLRLYFLSLLQVANDEPLMHIERHYTLRKKILILRFLVVFAFDISSVLNSCHLCIVYIS